MNLLTIEEKRRIVELENGQKACEELLKLGKLTPEKCDEDCQRILREKGKILNEAENRLFGVVNEEERKI